MLTLRISDAEAGSEDGSTALHCAAAVGSLDGVKALLKAGADSSLADNSGK